MLLPIGEDNRMQQTGQSNASGIQQTPAGILSWWSTPGLQGSKRDVGAGRM